MRAGPPILVAVTKVDMYPEWRRIVAIDEGHLPPMGLAEAPFALSSVLRSHGLATGDPSLEARERLSRRSPRRSSATSSGGPGRRRWRAPVAQVLPALDQLREPLAAELTALEDPGRRRAAGRDLREVRARLATLTEARPPGRSASRTSSRRCGRGPSSRSRPGCAQLLREPQDEIERIDPARAWPEVSQRVQADTAAAVRAAFLEATDGAAAIQATIAGLLADEAAGLDGAGRRSRSTSRRCGRAGRRSRAAPGPA